MKKRNIIIIALTALCLLFASCNMDQVDPNATGSLSVKVSDGGSRGANPNISMDVSSYDILAEGPDKAVVTKNDIEKANSSNIVLDGLKAGNWTITVTAKNAQKQAIGGGSATVNIKPSETATCTIIIKEYEGTGSFTLMLTGLNTSTGNYTIQILDSSDNNVASKEEKAIEGELSVTFDSLKNGFYTVKVTCPSDSNLPSGFVDTFRIVKDGDTNLRYTVSTDGTAIKIEEVITKTPKIDLKPTYSSGKFAVNESIVATATVTNVVENATYTWYLDGEALTGAGVTASNLSYKHNLEKGTHLLTYQVKVASENLVWSETKVITIIDAIIQPTINNSKYSEYSFPYNGAATFDGFTISNQNQIDNNWEYQWYIGDQPLRGQTQYDQVSISAPNNYAVGTYKLILKGIYIGERTYNLTSFDLLCYPSIRIESVPENIYTGERITLKATANPSLGKDYIAKWYVGDTLLGEGLELTTEKIKEIGTTTITVKITKDGKVFDKETRNITVKEVPKLAIRHNNAVVKEAVVYRNDVYSQSNSNSTFRNNFSVVREEGATYKWYLNDKEVYLGSNNDGDEVHLNVDDYAIGEKLSLYVVSKTGMSDQKSQPITLIVDEDPYIKSASQATIYSKEPTEIKFELVDNTNKVSGKPSWNLSFESYYESYKKYVSEPVVSADGMSATVTINPPEKYDGSSLRFNFSLNAQYTNTSGSNEKLSSSSMSVYINYSSGSHSGGGSYTPKNASLIIDNRVMTPGTATINATLENINAISYHGPSYNSGTILWRLNNGEWSTEEEVTKNDVIKSFDISTLQEGTYKIEVEYRGYPSRYGNGEYDSYFFATFFEVTNAQIEFDKAYFREIYDSANSSIGYEVIVIDTTKNVSEKNTVLFTVSENENSYDVTTVTGTASVDTKGFKELTSKNKGNSYIGNWKLPTITPENGLLNNYLDMFANNTSMFSPYWTKLVELTDKQKNSVDAYLAIDDALLTVFADVKLAVTGFDGAVALPATFNPQGEMTYNYEYVEDEVKIDKNALGLSFRPSKDGSILLLTAYIPKGDKAEKLLLPLIRESAGKSIAAKKGFGSDKAITLGAELPQLKTIAEALETEGNGDFFFDTLFGFRYGQAGSKKNYGGMWVLDTASAKKLPEGTPTNWVTMGNSINAFTSDGMSYDISRDLGYGEYDYSTIGTSLSIYDMNTGSSSKYKKLEFSNVEATENKVTFDVKVAQEGTVFKEYTGITLTRSNKNAGEVFQYMIDASNMEPLNDLQIIFKADGILNFYMPMGYGREMQMDVGTYTVNGNTITAVVDIFDLMYGSNVDNGSLVPDGLKVAITLSYNPSTGKVTFLDLPKKNTSVTFTIK